MLRVALIVTFALLLALSGKVDAACSVSEIRNLTEMGFDRNQIVQLCASSGESEPPGPGQQEAAPRGIERPPQTRDQGSGTFMLGKLEVALGAGEPWNTSVRDNAVVMTNETERGNLRHVTTNEPDDYGRRIFSTKVKFESHDDQSKDWNGPGLVYAFSKDYFFFYMIESDGTINLLAYDGNEQLNRMLSNKVEGFEVSTDTFVELGIVEDSQQIEMFLNGESTGMKIGNDRMGGGGVGIGAIGRGRFEFANFRYGVTR